MFNKALLTISEAAKELGVSLDTLRRWDKSGKLMAQKKKGGNHRYYAPKDLALFSYAIFRQAYDWVSSGTDIPPQTYCPTRDIFEARLISMQTRMDRAKRTDVSLLTVMAGEIGNNSFDHNLGQWPDRPGIFFADDTDKQIIVLADRGQGLLTTLRQVRPALRDEGEALRLAFTETISGRAPENRGNGLKLVRQVIAENPMHLFFQSGQAELRLIGGSPDLHLTTTPRIGDVTPTGTIRPRAIQGCLALIEYSQ